MTVTTPIVLLVFDRPRETAALVELLRAVRPRTVAVVADGPRPGHPDDVDRCAEVRRIVSTIDWPSELVTDFARVNQGSGLRVASGLDWAFGLFDRAIVLEDDVRPDRTFFDYCDAALERYADDERVMHIAGHNPLGASPEGSTSWSFSRFAPVWGWATWRRAWAANDITLARYRRPEVEAAVRARAVDPRHADALAWMLSFDVATAADAWDYSWSLAVRANDGRCVVPRVNLVRHVGFGAGATHLTDPAHLTAALRTHALEQPFTAPTDVAPDPELDRRLLCIDRLRDLRDLRHAAFVARALARAGDAGAAVVDPGVRNALAVFDDPESAVEVLEILRDHSNASALLDDALAVLRESSPPAAGGAA